MYNDKIDCRAFYGLVCRFKIPAAFRFFPAFAPRGSWFRLFVVCRVSAPAPTGSDWFRLVPAPAACAVSVSVSRFPVPGPALCQHGRGGSVSGMADGRRGQRGQIVPSGSRIPADGRNQFPGSLIMHTYTREMSVSLIDAYAHDARRKKATPMVGMADSLI